MAEPAKTSMNVKSLIKGVVNTAVAIPLVATTVYAGKASDFMQTREAVSPTTVRTVDHVQQDSREIEIPRDVKMWTNVVLPALPRCPVVPPCVGVVTLAVTVV